MMIGRRSFALQFGLGMTEAAFAQRAAVQLAGAPDLVWLNANENPDGPPAAALAAMREALPTAGRYHFQHFASFYATVARSENLAPEQVLVGAGSTEVLQIAVQAFTSRSRPLIAPHPTFEGPIELARTLGRPAVQTQLRPDRTADVRALAAEAARAPGGLIYLCNPNNPTSAAISRADLRWLIENLAPPTVLLVDEAYIHFAGPETESALGAVRAGREVIVARTFSKIWGMAGMRAGFACAKPALISRMAPFRNNVISIATARGVAAALEQKSAILAERRAALLKARGELCAWLRERRIPYIEPHGNFVMIDVGRDARAFIEEMPKLGVVPGRAFPPLDRMLRVSIGTPQEMRRFRDAFQKLYEA